MISLLINVQGKGLLLSLNVWFKTTMYW